MVHKKKHDMALNIGLGVRGNTFSDQTPTPTQFIRNCEEVGLFQDLQNVNPFEETFKRAVEAVKKGETLVLDKSFQSNPCDDTLHTPNVFPHIIDLPGGNQENMHFNDNLLKKDNPKNVDGMELHSKIMLEPNQLIMGNISYKRRKLSIGDKCVVKEVQNDENNLVSDEKEEIYLKITPSNDDGTNDLSQIQMGIKEKIKNNIQNKQMPVLIQLKVPIPKSKCINRFQKCERDRFSTFSKNSLKFECNVETPECNIFDLNKKRNITKNYNGLSKEKIDILERNRAAATRCREKKKIYVSYLEKLNKELTDTNKKLVYHNSYLKKQVSHLQAQLSKHHNCSLPSSKEENIIASMGNVDITCKSVEQFEMGRRISENIQNGIAAQENFITNDKILWSGKSVSNNARISLTDEFPSSSQIQSNSHVINNETFTTLYSKPCSMKSFHEQDKIRKIYIDHSYFNYPYQKNIRKKYPNSSPCRSKFTPGFLTMNVRNQNFDNKNNKTVDVLSQTESVLEIGTQDVKL